MATESVAHAAFEDGVLLGIQDGGDAHTANETVAARATDAILVVKELTRDET